MRSPQDIRRHLNEVMAEYVKAQVESRVTHVIEREVIRAREDVEALDAFAQTESKKDAP